MFHDFTAGFGMGTRRHLPADDGLWLAGEKGCATSSRGTKC